jgi:hypothetical protein
VSARSDLLKFLEERGIPIEMAIAILESEKSKKKKESWRPQEKAIPKAYEKR